MVPTLRNKQFLCRKSPQFQRDVAKANTILELQLDHQTDRQSEEQKEISLPALPRNEPGQTYAQMGKTADARRLIVKGLEMPDVEKDDPEIKRRGRETLAKLP